MWSYRTFALIQVSPQRYKEWQHYPYRGKQYVPPNAHWFWKGYLAIGCPFKTAVHDCSLGLTCSLRNMPQILCFKKDKSYWTQNQGCKEQQRNYSFMSLLSFLCTNFMKYKAVSPFVVVLAAGLSKCGHFWVVIENYNK